MPNLVELTPSGVDIPQGELHEAEVLTDATEIGEEVRCVIPTDGELQSTDPMPWQPWTTSKGTFYPKKGNRALVSAHPDGPPVIVWWHPAEDAEPDETWVEP
jgi:hypothetical protein